MNLAFAFISLSAAALLSAPMYLLHRVSPLKVSDTVTAFIAVSMLISGMVGQLLEAEVTVLEIDFVRYLLPCGVLVFVAFLVKVGYQIAWKHETKPIH